MYKIGRFLTIGLIFGFIIVHLVSMNVSTFASGNDIKGALFSIAHNIYNMTDGIIYAGCIIALAILFRDSKS